MDTVKPKMTKERKEGLKAAYMDMHRLVKPMWVPTAWKMQRFIEKRIEALEKINV